MTRKKIKKKGHGGRRKTGISLCLIARDEEEYLARCLRSAGSLVDEIVMVDTGSVDKTKKIAAQFGANIIDHAWKEDFSDARNVGLEQARGEWILHLDADEELTSDAVEAIRKAVSDSQHDAFLLTVLNLTGPNERDAIEQSFPSLRLFKHRPDRRFKGAFHEHIQINLTDGEEIGVIEARIRHFGYLDHVIEKRQKRQRNTEMVQETGWGEEYDEFLQANEDFTHGRFEAALEKYVNVMETVDQGSIYLSGITMRVVCCYQGLGKNEMASEWAEKGLRKWPDYTDLQYLHGLASYCDNKLDMAMKSFVACTFMGDSPAQYDTRSGVGSWSAMQGIAMVFEKLHRPDIAERAFAQALSMNNRDSVSAARLAGILMRGGCNANEARKRVSELIDMESIEVQKALEEVFAPSL